MIRSGLVTLLILLASNFARADYVIYIGGMPLNCSNVYGVPVNFILNTGLADVGSANPFSNPPIIVFNPHVLSQFTTEMQLFWFGHECAHHTVGANEPAADCMSIKTLRNMGLLSAAQIPILQSQILGAPGNMWTGHMPGPMRAQHFANCFNSP